MDATPCYHLYDFVNKKGENIIKEWIESLEKISRVQVQKKLDMLQQNGGDLSPQLLADGGEQYIKKLRVTNGRKVPTIRIMLCYGPLDMKTEFTLLQGVQEKDNEYIPAAAVKNAAKHRQEVIANPWQRCDHELVT